MEKTKHIKDEIQVNKGEIRLIKEELRLFKEEIIPTLKSIKSELEANRNSHMALVQEIAEWKKLQTSIEYLREETKENQKDIQRQESRLSNVEKQLPILNVVKNAVFSLIGLIVMQVIGAIMLLIIVTPQ